MKVEEVKIGERFILDDRSGVWELTSNILRSGVDENKALCVFGSKELFGTTISVDGNAFCYVIHENAVRQLHDTGIHQSTIDKPLKIRIAEEGTDDVLREIVNPTERQIAVLSSVETLRLIPLGKRIPRVYCVVEFAYDMDDNEYYISVIPQRTEGTRGEIREETHE